MDNQATVRNAERLAAKIRRDVVRMIGCLGQTGHLGGACSCADIVAALYGGRMRFRAGDPSWSGRDKFLFSKGHAAFAQYAAMAETGYFPLEELWNVKQLGSMLQGHPDRLRTPGIEAGTGSLGQGLSIAVGMAMAMRLDGNDDGKVYCVMGDGEMAEGQIWEAAMAAAHYKLHHLVGIVDQNGLQATGRVEERLNTYPLTAKWSGFGWNALETDGHDMRALLDALDQAGRHQAGPTVIIAGTVKGKGVSFAEYQAAFHNAALSRVQYDTAIAELDRVIADLSAV
jgi:transketolase